MRIVVRYFAHLRRVLGKKEEILFLPDGAKVLDLLMDIQEKYSSNLEFVGYQVTKKGEAVDFEEELYDGDIICIFPPVAGGTLHSSLEKTLTSKLTNRESA